MADFHQNGSVATLHNLTRMPLEMMEAQLRQFAASGRSR
jgi:glucosyl-3-phosphoglycerate synthase